MRIEDLDDETLYAEFADEVGFIMCLLFRYICVAAFFFHLIRLKAHRFLLSFLLGVDETTAIYILTL